MSDPKNPVPGDLHIDATEFAIVDRTPDASASLTKLRPGHKKAVDNLARLTPAQIKAAGLSAEDVTEVIALSEEHGRLGVHYAASAKLTEVLRDTQLDRGHLIAIRMSEMVEKARRRADRSPNSADILGPLEDLLEYQLGPAKKANSTKAKKEAEKKSVKPAPTDA